MIKLPKEIWIADNIFTKIGKILESLGSQSGILISFSKSAYKIYGKAILLNLSNSNSKVFNYILKSKSLREIEDIKDIIRKNKIGIIMAVGGGGTIDICKIASFKANIPFISVPTILSHDGIASNRAVMPDAENKSSILVDPPLGVIADLKILGKCPVRFLRAGCGDILSNLSAVRDWKLAWKFKKEGINEYACALSETSAASLLDNSYQMKTEAGIETLLSSIIMSGLAMCIAGSSRPSSGAEHQFAQALDKITKNDALHGEKCGIGTIMMLYLHGGNEYKLVKRTLKRIGAPTTARELGVPKDKIIEALAIAHKARGRYTILGDKGLSYKKAFELAKITGIIDE